MIEVRREQNGQGRLRRGLKEIMKEEEHILMCSECTQESGEVTFHN